MILINSHKPDGVLSVCKGLYVIYTNKTLIKDQIYCSYSINEVTAGQTYIARKPKRIVSAMKRKAFITYSSGPWDY